MAGVSKHLEGSESKHAFGALMGYSSGRKSSSLKTPPENQCH